MSTKTKGHIEGGEQIYQISEMVAGAFTLAEVLDKLAQAAVQITETRACSIRLLDDSAAEMKMRSTYGLSDTYRNKGPVSKEDPVIKADSFDFSPPAGARRLETLEVNEMGELTMPEEQ